MSPACQFLPRAVADLEAITGHFVEAEAGDPALALRFGVAVSDALQDLASQPRAGSPGRFRSRALHDVRIWRVPDFPKYLVIYALLADRIYILRIVHGARDTHSSDRGQG